MERTAELSRSGSARWQFARGLYGLAALIVYAAGFLLIVMWARDSSRDVYLWAIIIWDVAVILLALRGWPSWPSIAALLLSALNSWRDADEILVSTKFHALLWLCIAALLFRRFYAKRSAPVLLLLIGSVGCFVIFGLHAFGSYTQEVILDGMGWTHSTFAWLDSAASVATICLPLGLFLFIREWRASPNPALQPTADRLENYGNEIRK
jgi:hypothetical protein